METYQILSSSNFVLTHKRVKRYPYFGGGGFPGGGGGFPGGGGGFPGGGGGFPGGGGGFLSPELLVDKVEEERERSCDPGVGGGLEGGGGFAAALQDHSASHNHAKNLFSKLVDSFQQVTHK